MLFQRSRIENLLPPITAVDVAHYTKIGSLCHFIASSPVGWSSAWATPVQFLNDRKELSLGLEVLQEVANKAPRAGTSIRNLIDDLLAGFGGPETDAFQMSFSGNPDELGQWRGYATNGMGCSVVTDALQVQNVADVAGWVLYDPKKQKTFARKVLAGLRGESNNNLIRQVLVASASYMKHDGFQPEREFRLLKFPDLSTVRFRESGERLVPYIDYLDRKKTLPITKILIGPGWQLPNIQSAEFRRNHVVQGVYRLLAACNLHSTNIEPSRIPYDPK